MYIKAGKKDEPKLLEILNIANFKTDKEYEDDYYVGYVIYYVKWYDDYESVKAVNSFIEEDSDCLRGLIAIGEDNAIEKYGNTQHIGLFVVSQIDW